MRTRLSFGSWLSFSCSWPLVLPFAHSFLSIAISHSCNSCYISFQCQPLPLLLLLLPLLSPLLRFPPLLLPLQRITFLPLSLHLLSFSSKLHGTRSVFTDIGLLLNYAGPLQLPQAYSTAFPLLFLHLLHLPQLLSHLMAALTTICLLN